MSTDVWFRNPDNYVRELVEVEVGKIAWDRGYLVKKSIDPDKHASLYYGRAIPWEALVIGDQGTAHIGPDNPMTKPKGVYPTWCYGEDAALLEEMIAHPVGENEKVCFDLQTPPDERPVLGQKHVVVITDMPDVKTGIGRRFIRFLKEMQEDYPSCVIHIHGLYSFRMTFGMGFKSADYEPRTLAQKGKIVLPSGKEEKFERAHQNPLWLKTSKFSPADLQVPRNRCIFNIESAVWAGEWYDKLYNFSTRNTGQEIDTTSSDSKFLPVEVKGSPIVGRGKSGEGDQFHCDTCSLQTQCKYFREGAVCSVPGAEPTELARFFKTRDSSMIIDGLGTLVAAQTRRLERGMQEEEAFGELQPEVTKLINSVFDQGVKLAKLVDPSLRGGGVNVNVHGGGAASVSVGNPRQMVAEIIRSLELQGVARADITPAMIQGVMEGMVDPGRQRQALEGEVVRRESA